MNSERLSLNSNHCFVCGQANPAGLQIRFRIQGDLCIGHFVPNETLSGYKGMIHGGILYAILDDAMANWLFLQGEQVTTGRAEIRYRNPLPVSTPVVIEAWQTGRRNRLIQMAGHILLADSRKPIAEAKGSFFALQQKR